LLDEELFMSQPSTPQPSVARQSKDIVLKLVAEALGGDLFRRFNLPLAPIVAVISTELPQLEVRTHRTDLLFLLADGTILHLEFQTKQRPIDIKRFLAYNIAAYLHHDRPVRTVILYGPGIRTAPSSLEAGSCTFVVDNILVGREDGAAVLQRLSEKAARGEIFTPADRVDLILSPLMRQRRTLAKVLPEAVKLTTALPEAEQEPTVGALLGLAYHYVDESVITAILEGLSMTNPLQTLIEKRMAEGEARGLAEGEARGLAEGEARGKRVSLRTFLEAKFGLLPDTIARRIAAADERELDALLVRAASVQSIDDF